MKNIVICVNQPIIATGLSFLCREIYGDLNITECQDGFELSHILRTVTGIDLLILEVSIDEGPTMTFVRKLRKKILLPKVLLVISGSKELANALAATMEVEACIQMSAPVHHYQQTIYSIIDEQRKVSVDPGQAAAAAKTDEEELVRIDALSQRELELALLLAKGFTTREIAGRMRISESTVASHKYRIMNKKGFTGTRDLIQYIKAHLNPE